VKINEKKEGRQGKQRLGDREVVVKLPPAAYQERDIVLLDDVASSGEEPWKLQSGASKPIHRDPFPYW